MEYCSYKHNKKKRIIISAFYYSKEGKFTYQKGKRGDYEKKFSWGNIPNIAGNYAIDKSLYCEPEYTICTYTCSHLFISFLPFLPLLLWGTCCLFLVWPLLAWCWSTKRQTPQLLMIIHYQKYFKIHVTF